MNRKSQPFLAFLLGAAALTAPLGCELLTTVDRTKVPGAGGAGGSGATTSTGDTTSTSTSSTTSSTSTGTGGGCNDPATDCPPTGTACIVAACDQGACTTNNAASATPCTDNGGKLCDGKGACVACLTDTDCGNNQVCDNANACVPAGCTDGKKNGAETDVDCGGGTCSGCDNAKTCGGGADCKSGYCAGTTCAACTADAQCGASHYCEMATGTCKSQKGNGSSCGGGSECSSGFCVDSVCCDGACNGACVACTAAKKQSGMGDGACGQAKDGTDPHGTCPAQMPLVCGNTGTCTAGACTKVAMGTSCGMASCTNNTVTPAPTCDGAGTCASAMGMSCGLYACNAMTLMCETNCMGSDANCAATAWCNTTLCYQKGGINTFCNANNQCLSGNCNLSTNKCVP